MFTQENTAFILLATQKNGNGLVLTCQRTLCSRAKLPFVLCVVVLPKAQKLILYSKDSDR